MNRGFNIVITILASLFLINMQVKAQIPQNVKSYAVIGVFNMEMNAERFAQKYAAQSLNTEVRKNDFNNLFYVYTLESDDVEEVRQTVLNIRSQYTELSNAWLYNGNYNCLHIPSDQLFPKQEVKTNIEIPTEGEKVVSMVEVKPVPTEIKKPRVVKPDNVYWIYFNTYNITNHSDVDGNITVIDGERNKDIGTEKTNQLIALKDPNNGTNKMRFTSDIFGYQILSQTLDLDEPVTNETKGYVSMIGDSIIVDFPISRFHNGDFMTMWNVYFYIDAAIMKEESVIELNQLLNMMYEDESIRIKIHGHTNGNSRGKVKHLDLDDKKFFSLNGSHLEETASAKQLSLYRAYTIKYWLMDQGIDEDRMEIVGWGGKKMIYDKNSTNADKNVRVEIEIL